MGKVHKAIGGRLREFIEAQHVFFVATAPLAGDGLVNVSPRGVSGLNLAAWREIRARLDDNGDGTVDAVFVRSIDDPVGSELDAALRAAW